MDLHPAEGKAVAADKVLRSAGPAIFRYPAHLSQQPGRPLHVHRVLVRNHARHARHGAGGALLPRARIRAALRRRASCVHEFPRRPELSQLDRASAERGWSWWGRAIFYVADVDALYERALAAGLNSQFAPLDAAWGERYFHITDPDGHEISFARPLPSS